ncbi:MAG TPA: NAD(P)-dependent oxidoreductase, partial [Candidatus Limnocylindria bacterium]|nr:NAD(P)-dependent oxidoreductase [Candidatus Limnocylindria bacterium]
RAVDFARRYRFLPLPGDGHGRMQPIHYEDLAAAVATLVERGASGIVDAGGAEPITIRDAASDILAALGLPLRLVRIPLPAARLAARTIDGLTESRWAEKVDRALEDRVVDNGRLVALTGVRPRAFAQGVRDQVAAL